MISIKPTTTSLRAALIVCTLATLAVGCSTSTSSIVDAALPAADSSSPVGGGGATVGHPSGLQLVIPPGALSEPTAISVTEIPDPKNHAFQIIGPALEIGPNGTLFEKPVTLSLPFDATKLPENHLQLFIFTADGKGNFVPLITTVADGRLVAEITHLSPFIAGVGNYGGPCNGDHDCPGAGGGCLNNVCCNLSCPGGCKGCATPGKKGYCASLSLGLPCDDHNLCTQTSGCIEGGICIGSNPLDCTLNTNECQGKGKCDPQTGICSGGPGDGAPCANGEGTCQNGTCVYGPPPIAVDAQITDTIDAGPVGDAGGPASVDGAVADSAIDQFAELSVDALPLDVMVDAPLVDTALADSGSDASLDVLSDAVTLVDTVIDSSAGVGGISGTVSIAPGSVSCGSNAADDCVGRVVVRGYLCNQSPCGNDPPLVGDGAANIDLSGTKTWTYTLGGLTAGDTIFVEAFLVESNADVDLPLVGDPLADPTPSVVIVGGATLSLDIALNARHTSN